jgi:hypothetical protein
MKLKKLSKNVNFFIFNVLFIFESDGKCTIFSGIRKPETPLCEYGKSVFLPFENLDS